MAIVTVHSSGGPAYDYTSLANAEAGEQGNLTGIGPLEIECYSFADSTAVTFDGWTTTASDYIRVYTPSAERHDGKWNTSKYRLSVAIAFANILVINEDYVRIEGLQIEGTEATGSGHGNIVITNTANAASSDIRIESCLIRKGSSRNNLGNPSLAGGSGKTTIRNSVIYGTLGGSNTDGIYCTFGSNAATVICENVTVAIGTGRYAFYRDAGTLTLTNCYAHATTESYSGTITRTTCAHSSASVFSGSTASVAHSTSNFTNVTSGSEDYHLTSGSTLIGAGTDLSATFTTDIDGNTRSAPWDIGADEYTSGVTGITGTSNFALDNISLTATGKVYVKADANFTLDEIVEDWIAATKIQGTFNATLDSISFSSAATVLIQANSNITLDEIVQSAVAANKIQGTFNQTLDNISFNGTGTVLIKANCNLALTEINFSGTGVQVSVIAGSFNHTLDEIALLAQARNLIKGTANFTLDEIVHSSIAANKIQATFNKTLDGLVLESTAQVQIKGSMNVTLGTITLIATGGEPSDIAYNIFESSAFHSLVLR